MPSPAWGVHGKIRPAQEGSTWSRIIWSHQRDHLGADDGVSSTFGDLNVPAWWHKSMLYVSDWRACSAQWINNGLPSVTAAASQFLQKLPLQTIRAQVARGWGNVDTRVLVCSGPLLHTINYWLRYWMKFDLKRLSEINVVWEYCKVWKCSQIKGCLQHFLIFQELDFTFLCFSNE